MATVFLEPIRDKPLHVVRWLILARMLVIILSICVPLIRTLAQADIRTNSGSVYILLISLAIMNAGYFGLLRFIRGGMTTFVVVQFMIDIAVETGLVFVTGGVDSNFVNLYFITIMAAPMLLSRGWSALCASLATIGLSTVTVMYLTGTWMHLVENSYWPAEPLNIYPFLSQMLAIVTAFFTVAFLSGLLSERLAMASSLNEEILQGMAEGVAVFDNQGQVIFVNREFERIFSPGRPIQLGEKIEQVFAGPGNESLRKVLQSHSSASFELEPEENTESRRLPVEVRTSILGEQHSPRGMVTLVIDLSLQRRAEIAERRAERFSAVSEMAAGLAHEIRNPLASVRGSVQEISTDFPEGSTNRKLADIVLNESDRLDRIITSFLQFARQRALRPTDCRLGRLLENILTLLENREDTGSIRITLELGEKDPHIRCDPDQIQEVFLNLGVNAVNAMKGEGSLTIRYPHEGVVPPDATRVADFSENGVTVSFKDTGSGLPPGSEVRIFEPFYTTKPHGTGLGLSIVRRVVESHEGRIWVRSEPGEGATFFVWLPLRGPFKRGAPES